MYFVGCLEDNHALSFIICIVPIWYSKIPTLITFKGTQKVWSESGHILSYIILCHPGSRWVAPAKAGFLYPPLPNTPAPNSPIPISSFSSLSMSIQLSSSIFFKLPPFFVHTIDFFVTSSYLSSSHRRRCLQRPLNLSNVLYSLVSPPRKNCLKMP